MIYILFFVSLLFAFRYFIIIRDYLDGWNETPQYVVKDRNNSTKVSVVIAAYNEQKYIKDCVESILKNNYPTEAFEIIVVDNNSSDKTGHILSKISYKNLTTLIQKKGHKKESLELGISESNGELILCTDADCVVEEDWIQSMVDRYELHGGQFILGPVVIKKYTSLPERFQAFDMLAMMGVTCGGIQSETSYLANGANMAFAKSLYEDLGEIPRKDLASGDDVFLLHAAVNKGYKVLYNKNRAAIVKTHAIKGWKDLIQQRIRWASKATSYISSKDRNRSAFIFVFCLSILINFLLTPFTGGVSLFFALFQLFIKAIFDYAFIERTNIFFQQKRLMKYFIPSFLVHFAYILFSGFSGIFGMKYSWKGKVLR